VNLLKMIAELSRRRDATEFAIRALENLAVDGAKRRGRPPKWMTEARRGVKAETVANGRRKSA
jgi:hypothetical protein